MRALLLVLLLANILFFAWSQWFAPAPTAGGHPTPSSQDSHSIRLLREEPMARAGSVGAQGGGAVGPGETATCVSGGPYLDRASAEQAAARLDGLGFGSRLRPARDDVWVGQWVRIEGLATAEDAENALAALRAAGIFDAYLLAEEPDGRVVSLGVFKDAGRSAQVIALARQAGFAPRVEDRFRADNVFWLDVDRDANAGLPGLEMFRVRDDPSSRVELRACPETDSATLTGPAP